MQPTTQPSTMKQQRKYMDCRDQPGSDCSLRLSGTEKEVLEAAKQHAVSAHGMKDSRELADMLRAGLKDER